MSLQKPIHTTNVRYLADKAGRTAIRHPSDFAPWLRSEGAARYPVFKNNVVFFPVHLNRPPEVQNE